MIERRGTGGGNFRLMYSRFLEEADRHEARSPPRPRLRWTTLPARCWRRARRTHRTPALWSRIGDEAAAVLEAEERLWPALAAESAQSLISRSTARSIRSRSTNSPGSAPEAIRRNEPRIVSPLS